VVGWVFVSFAVLALLSLAPLLLALRRVGTPRGRRESAIALHRAQLEELDRDLQDGAIAPAEHHSAKLEVQRRLLNAADLPDAEIDDTKAVGARRGALILAAILVPVIGSALYLVDGRPDLPSANALPKADPLAQADDAERLISTLRAKLAAMDPSTPMAAQGYLLLGNAEASRGHIREAVQAWRIALAAVFNPALAAQTAEGQFQLDGKMTPQTRALFERALAEAPPDAPWRGFVQQRLDNAGR